VPTPPPPSPLNPGGTQPPPTVPTPSPTGPAEPTESTSPGGSPSTPGSEAPPAESPEGTVEGDIFVRIGGDDGAAPFFFGIAVLGTAGTLAIIALQGWRSRMTRLQPEDDPIADHHQL
jgi:hypothetical protein